FVLGSRNRSQEPTFLIRAFPRSLLHLLQRSFKGCDQGAVHGSIQTLPIDAHARSHYQAMQGMRAEGLQQLRRAKVVYAGIFRDLVHALSDADQSREMNDGIYSIQRARNSFGVANI